MDVLSLVLSAVRVSGAIFFRFEGAAPWGFGVPDITEAGPLLAPNAQRVVNYHLIAEGRALIQLDGGTAFWAECGDIVVLPHGTAHTVSNGQPNDFVDSGQGLEQLIPDRPTTIRLVGNPHGEQTKILCGFIGCERISDQLFLSGLPNFLTVGLREIPGDRWLLQSIEHLVSEAEESLPGSAALLSRMSEALFVETLRRYMRGLPTEATGWLAAAQDPLVGQALASLHNWPRRRWTVADLANEAGSSPSVITKRFKHLLGETPTAYLRRWRMYLASQMLVGTSVSIVNIAADVGYESEASFNRAFKAEHGVPPARFRRQNDKADSG